MKILDFAFIAYPVTDMARARAFYEGVLGLQREAKPNDDSATWLEYEVGPHTLGIGCNPMMKPSTDGPSLAFEVEDFDAAVKRLQEHDVKFLMPPFQTPFCRGAVFLDPDGNKLLIHKRNA